MPHRHSYGDSFDLRWLRSAIDLAICFVIAVILLRSFVLEGYLISTGSMAPGLLGFHRRIQCPTCQFDFAFGVQFDDSVDSASAAIVEPEESKRYATCPNCGQSSIDVRGVPNSHGDQLLVQKHVFDLRKPRRWETIVFRNPASPEEAYVKRVVGLPGDRIRIINGDVYINGRIARKTYEQQQSMRIPVSDIGHLADADDWQLPWELDDGWKADRGALHCQLNPETPEDTASDAGQSLSADKTRRSPGDVQWLRFRHWRWHGGHHIAETPLIDEEARGDWKSFVARFDELPITWFSCLSYDDERQVLRCEGVMPEDLQRDLLRRATSQTFRSAVFRLAALSHLAPVTDRYGYNAMRESPEYVVSDLMLCATLSWSAPPKSIHVQIPVESQTFGLVVHPADGKVDLISIDEKTVVRRGTCPRGPIADSGAGSMETMVLEVSNFDRELIVAINGQPSFDAFPVDATTAPVDESLEASLSRSSGEKMDAARAMKISLRLEQQKRWALGVSAGDVRLTDLEMYRDVFYTPGRRRNAIESEFTVPPDQYFVQGDNSPVSSDSRNWANPCVPHKLLIGKPFLIHLPSRPAVLEFAGWKWPIRIPDWSRIGYIR